jgi:hypothetical protein
VLGGGKSGIYKHERKVGKFLPSVIMKLLACGTGRSKRSRWTGIITLFVALNLKFGWLGEGEINITHTRWKHRVMINVTVACIAWALGRVYVCHGVRTEDGIVGGPFTAKACPRVAIINLCMADWKPFWELRIGFPDVMLACPDTVQVDVYQR